MNKRKISLKLSGKDRDDFLIALEKKGFAESVEIFSADYVQDDFVKGRRPRVDLIVYCPNETRDQAADFFFLWAHLAGIPVIDPAHCLAALTKRVDTNQFDIRHFLTSAVPQTFTLRLFRAIKETLEPFVAMILLAVLSPLFILIALLIKFTSRGSAIFVQRRSGHFGREFLLYKFRTMKIDSESQGWQWATQEDPRITTFGKFLRKTRLDELPQLWNIIKGEMGFIGPRPERPEAYLELQKEIELFSLRTIVRPGITGLAQVCAGYAATVEESRTKLEHDLYYIQHMSLILDVAILINTLKVILLGKEFIPPRGETAV